MVLGHLFYRGPRFSGVGRMKNLLPTLALSIPAAALMAAFAPGGHYAIQEPASSTRWEVMPSTPMQVAAPPTAPAVPMSGTLAGRQDAWEEPAGLLIIEPALKNHAPPSPPVPAMPIQTPVSSLGPSLSHRPPSLMPAYERPSTYSGASACGPGGCGPARYRSSRRGLFRGRFFRRR